MKAVEPYIIWSGLCLLKYLNQKFSTWLYARYRKTINSIAFLPVIITILFLGASFGMILFDFSEPGKHIKSKLHWLSLKDATTARSIISSIVSGILSLTVFSFSMVMIVLNQTASQMSNRILDKLIGNKFQQSVLGVYSGTIVFALFLLSTIRDIDTGIYVPALSTYLLIALTVADLFLFFYFLHYITQSVKYETIIRQIARQTKQAIEQSCTQSVETPGKSLSGLSLQAPADGNFQGFQKSALLEVCIKNDLVVSFLFPYGSYLIKGTPFITVTGTDTVDEELAKHINSTIAIDPDMTIHNSYHNGFRKLMEVAVKALSPGINDPGTAVASLQALASLLAVRMQRHAQNEFADDKGNTRIFAKEKSFDEIFNFSLLPIWDYGKDDRMIQHAFFNILTQLQQRGSYQSIESLLLVVRTAILKKSI